MADAADATDRGAELMLAYQAGDEQAFDALVHAYSGQVFGLLTRFLGPVAGREDLVQDVFLRVVRARDRYQPTARFTTWLYRIAFNLCINQRERAGHARTRSLHPGRTPEEGELWDLADERSPAPSDALEQDDVVQAVRAAVAGLPEAQRMALILARYHEMPYAEIGQTLGSSEKAIKSLIHRAREALRERLAGFLQEDAR